MKNTAIKLFGGKVAKVLLAAGIITLASVSACKKDDSNSTGNTSATVTESEAAELTTDAVIPSTGGLVAQENTSLSLYTSNSATMSCGETKDTTISKSSLSGVVPSYSYALNWSYALDCNAAIPQQFTFSFTGSSNYSGTDLQSNDASTGSLTLSGIQPLATDYTLNASYERQGKQTSKIGAQNSFTSNLKITSGNILISKSTQQIISGTATVSITGATTGGKSFSFGGTITFLGGQKATLVLNSGTTYNIAWS